MKTVMRKRRPTAAFWCARPQKPAASALAEGNIQITNRVGAAKTSAQPLTRAVTEEQRIEAANETMQKAEKVESKALYETEPNISFEYHVVGNYLKRKYCHQGKVRPGTFPL